MDSEHAAMVNSPSAFLIAFTSDDGEQREETWPSIEHFRAWAATQGQPYSFTAYREDDDGEWMVVEKGRL